MAAEEEVLRHPKFWHALAVLGPRALEKCAQGASKSDAVRTCIDELTDQDRVKFVGKNAFKSKKQLHDSMEKMLKSLPSYTAERLREAMLTDVLTPEPSDNAISWANTLERATGCGRKATLFVEVSKEWRQLLAKRLAGEEHVSALEMLQSKLQKLDGKRSGNTFVDSAVESVENVVQILASLQKKGKRTLDDVDHLERKVKMLRHSIRVAYQQSVQPLRTEYNAAVVALNLAKIQVEGRQVIAGELYDVQDSDEDSAMCCAGDAVPAWSTPAAILAEKVKEVQRFFCFIVSREQVRQNRLQQRPPFDGVDKEFTRTFETKQVHNVRRRDDPASEQFSAILASCAARMSDRDKRLAVLNLVMWRVVAGTPAFALLLGWMSAWTIVEQDAFRSAMGLLCQKKLAGALNILTVVLSK